MSGSIVSLFLADSDEEKAARARLIEREDRVFEIQSDELVDHAAHVRADIPRFALIDARQKLILATTNRKQDRNFIGLMVVGLILFIKTGISWADLAHFFTSL